MALTFKGDGAVSVGDDADEDSTDALQSSFATAEALRRHGIRRMFERMVYGAEHFQNASLLSGEYAVCTGQKGSVAPLAVLTLAVGAPPDYLERMRSNRLKYVTTQGLQYCEYSHTLDGHRTDHWSKLIAVQELFRMEYPVVLWMDADALFMRCDQSFFPILDNFSTVDVIFSADVININRNEAFLNSSIQTSVFLMRNSIFASGLLETWLGDAYFSCRHRNVQEQCAVQTYHTQMLQCAEMSSGPQCNYSAAREYHTKVALVPWNYFNSPGNPSMTTVGSDDRRYQPGDFIMHWGGGQWFSFGSDKYRMIMDTFWSGACKCRPRHFYSEPVDIHRRCDA